MGKHKVRSFSDYFWVSQGMLKFCGVLPMPERGLSVNYFLIVLSISSMIFLFFPGFYIIAFHATEIDAAAKVDIIAGESLEIWVTTIKGCRQIDIYICLLIALAFFLHKKIYWGLVKCRIFKRSSRVRDSHPLFSLTLVRESTPSH